MPNSSATENVFTVFFHGSSENQDRDKNQEAIHVLSKLLEEANPNRAVSEKQGGRLPNDHFLIVDGVGSVGSGEPNEFGIVNKTPGTFDPSTVNKAPKTNPWSRTDTKLRDYGDPKKVFSDWRYGWIPSVEKRGLLLGEGMDDLIAFVINTLAQRFIGNYCGHKDDPVELRVEDVPKFTLNLMGWSRGAVACIRTANWVYHYLGPAPIVNIFAFDPVPGGNLLEKFDDVKTLAPNVKSYTEIICLHDQRQTFTPVDGESLILDRQAATKPDMALLPMPGFHSTPLYGSSNVDNHLHDCVEVAHYLAWKFLLNKGTKLAPYPGKEKFTPLGLCEHYAAMMLHLASYGAMDLGTWWYQHSTSPGLRGVAIRNVLRNRTQYVRRGSAAYFLNEHHVACFLKMAPNLARYLGLLEHSEKSLNDSKYAATAASFKINLMQQNKSLKGSEYAKTSPSMELNLMKQNAPHSYRLLMQCMEDADAAGPEPAHGMNLGDIELSAPKKPNTTTPNFDVPSDFLSPQKDDWASPPADRIHRLPQSDDMLGKLMESSSGMGVPVRTRTMEIPRRRSPSPSRSPRRSI